MPAPRRCFRFVCLAIVTACGLLATRGWSQQPLTQLPVTRLDHILPLAFNPGQAAEVTIGGTDLDDVDRLMFSHPGITATRKLAPPGPFDSGPQPVANQFVVTVAANVPLGRYEVRAAGKYGVSNPRTLFVGDLPVLTEMEPNQTHETATAVELPADVSGQFAAAADVDCFRFTPKMAGRIILEAYAHRADSQADLVIVVTDVAGREVASSRDGPQKDPLIDFDAVANQTYFLRLYDAAYRGGQDFAYRVRIGALPHIDFLFPPAGTAGTNAPFTVFGRNLPGGQNAGLAIGGRPLQKIAVNVALPAAGSAPIGLFITPAGGDLSGAAYRVKNDAGWSNSLLAGVATAVPVNEIEPNNTPAQAQKLTIPCEVMGQSLARRDADWFSFEAKLGEKLTVEIISQRMGYATDPILLVQHVVQPAAADRPEQVNQLALMVESAIPDSGPEFDTQNRDPVFSFVAPADGLYRVLVRDARNAIQADPRQVYRLAIRRSQPDFQLAAIPVGSSSSLLLRKGGQVAIRVVAFRRDGFDGEIQVTATGLPGGVTCSDAVIGPERSAATLVLTAVADAAPADAAIQVVGRSPIGTAVVQRSARFGGVMGRLPPRPDINQPQMPTAGRLSDNLLLSVSAGEIAPTAVQAGGGKVWETSRAGILKIPYARTGSFTGKFTLLPVDLPANVEAPVLTINPNTNSGEYELKLRSNTPVGTYSFVFAGIAEQVDYARNPEAAQVAADRKVQVDKIATDTAAEAKLAADAKAASDKLAADTAAAQQAAVAAKAQADQALIAKTEAMTVSIRQLNQAKAAAAANANDANLAAAVAAAQKLADEAVLQVKAATDAVAAAQKSLDEATAQAKAAADAKLLTDEKAAAAAERARLAMELKAQTDKLATDTTNNAKPQKVNVAVVSTPVTLKIVPAPITLAVANTTVAVKQGMSLELPVTIARLFNFNDPVNLAVVLPPGVGGVSIPNVQIPAGQTQTKFTLAATANATPGNHALIVRATLTLNGQGLVVDQPVNLTIQEVPPTTQ